MMAISLVEPGLVRRIEQWGHQINRPVEKILENAVRTYLDELEQQAIHTETQAFWEMHDDLLEIYPEEYIALYRGQVVAHDNDVSRLEERVREQYGSLPVLIAPVRPGSPRDLIWLGGRLDKVESIG